MAHEVSGTAPTLPDLCRLKIGISIPCRRLFHPSLVPTMLFVLADQVEQRRFLQISIAIIPDGTRNCVALGDRGAPCSAQVRRSGWSLSIAK
jgi:hypothetical protein